MMANSTSICLSCGLCCDGTLIGFVKIENEEMPRLKEFMDIEEVEGNGFFVQPCKKFCDGCTVYAKRPKQCGEFKCGLLNSVEQKELDFGEAVEMIDEVKDRKSTLEEILAASNMELKSSSFYFQMVEMKQLLKKNLLKNPLNKSDKKMLSEVAQLDDLLTKRFDLSLF